MICVWGLDVVQAPYIGDSLEHQVLTTRRMRELAILENRLRMDEVVVTH